MHQTAWTSSSRGSSFPSDRLPPKQPKPTSKQATARESLPKSPALRTLESLLAAVHDESNASMPDSKGGCFCQARTHPLSLYTPICTSCALPLCTLNPPSHACPHCLSPLLTPAQRTSLIARIETQIAETIVKETQERERREEQARREAGAFPALLTPTPHPHSKNASPAPSKPSSRTATPTPQQHKVLSLNSKTKRAVLTTTTVTPKSTSASPAPSRPGSPPVQRIPPPLGADVLFAKGRLNPKRPWENLALRGMGPGVEWVYVPPSSNESGDVGRKGKRKAKGKGKGRDEEMGETRVKEEKGNASRSDSVADAAI